MDVKFTCRLCGREVSKKGHECAAYIAFLAKLDGLESEV